ncbi:trimethylamine methyltransferase family protein [Nitratireductor sp. ZSWI3]|uniref:trimethylamine methyltransferase family protein n=1 Tax=Nitratireductor sp. ZSWI3 TaxID=2966359 RepID=UPI00214F6620|nr:trimethylamine methyltransferase family protein [Nitratireductor sp. ZSWI3]MCR4267807.1 trimethylamine methyltransferase family protein [Nitratireductor sp. ZSWI3]
MIATAAAETGEGTGDQPRRGRTGRGERGGAAARRAARTGGGPGEQLTYIRRVLKPFEVLDEEGLALIEANADTVLEEIGIEFRDDAEALALWKDAGADVRGERVHFPKGLCRTLLKTAPATFTQHARNPARSVEIGGNATVFAPVYGPPFVRDLEGNRRYATIEDFRNFVKLAYMAPSIHHSGGTVCEPVDVPVNKRHLDMVFAHMRYSDKPFMGSVTAPERAEDTVAMAKILFGEEFVDNNTVVINLINANSPMVFDETMLGAAKVYARANQACIVTPFILAGAMSPVTVAGTLTQVLAEVLAGAAFTQLVRPGAPVLFGTFASSISMQSGAPTFGTPEPSLVSYGAAQLARRAGLPFRTGGSLTGSKVADAQAAYESANTLNSTVLAGTNFVLHAAGWLEGGLVSSYEKFMMDIDQLGMQQRFCQPVDLSENGQAMDAIREVGPGSHYLGCSHTQANFQTAFYRSSIADNNSYEQWAAEGEKAAHQRANQLARQWLETYQAPPLDAGIEEGLVDFIARRKESMPDAFT